MKKYRIVIIFLIPLLMLSCENWLNDHEIGDQLITETFFNSVDDLEKILNGGYAAILGVEGEGLASSPFFIGTLAGDFVAPFAPNYDKLPDHFLNEYRRMHSLSGPSSFGQRYMKYLSRATNNANMVIDALENGSLEDQPKFKERNGRLRGEAYMLRALSNFEITKLVGKQYNSSTSSSDLAGLYPTKPILSSSDIPRQRLTVEESYNQLISDLEKAIELLPLQFQPEQNSPFYGTRRFTKDAARALMAKVYFQKHDFENTKILIDSILGPTPGEPDYYPLTKGRDLDEIYWNREDEPYGPGRIDEDDAEIICDFLGESAEGGPNAEFNVYGFAFTPDPAFGEMGRSRIDEDYAKGYFAMSERFISYADFDPGDSRYQVFIDEIPGDGFDGNLVMYWWPIKFASDRINVMWYRSAEFMLMRAECNARLGNEQDAIDDLDAIKDRAGVDFYESDPFAMPTLIEEIIRERARELYLENYRYWELLRLGSLGDAKLHPGDRSGDDIAVGNASGVNWDDPALLYELPDYE